MMTDLQTAALLREQDRFLILTHIRPDGDTIGSAAGLCAALRQMGKEAYALPNPGVTRHFAPYLTPYIAPEEYRPSFILSVDTASTNLIQKNGLALLGQIDLAIDHHISYEMYAKEACVDASCAACGELIYRIAVALGPLTREIALPLYMAIATDTGCFQYSNTTSATHRIAAALMDTGIDYRGVNKIHFRTKSLRRMQLEGKLVETMSFFEDGAIAVSAITLSLLEQLGATEEDAEDLASIPGQIEGVQAAVTIREQRDGGVKISLRTMTEYVNASAVCALLGGGGHAAAAGCTTSGTVEDAKAAMLQAIVQVRREAASSGR